MRFDSGKRYDEHHCYDESNANHGEKDMISKLSRAVKQLAIAAKIKRLNEIIAAVAGQPFGTTVAAQATALSAGLAQLTTASDAKDAAAAEATRTTGVQAAKNEIVNTLVEKFFVAIESATEGDPAQLATTTVDLQKSGGTAPAVGQLPAPQNLHATTGDFPGTTDVHVDRVKGSSSYAWRHTTDPNTATSWVNDPVTTKSSATIGNLVSGTKYYFQSAAIGAAGQSPWSDPAVSMAT